MPWTILSQPSTKYMQDFQTKVMQANNLLNLGAKAEATYKYVRKVIIKGYCFDYQILKSLVKLNYAIGTPSL